MMLFVIGSVISCSNGSDDSMDVIIDEMGEEMMMTTTNYSMGDFVSGAHVTTGEASVNLEKNDTFIK